MKIPVTFDVEVPNVDNWSHDEIRQLIFDTMINYTIVQHRMDAIKWLAKAKGDESSQEHMISVYHNTWADILSKMTYTIMGE